MEETPVSGPRIAWLLIDENNCTELLPEKPEYYSGTLKQIVYWEVEQS